MFLNIDYTAYLTLPRLTFKEDSCTYTLEDFAVCDAEKTRLTIWWYSEERHATLALQSHTRLGVGRSDTPCVHRSFVQISMEF